MRVSSNVTRSYLFNSSSFMCFVGLDEPNESFGSSRPTKHKTSRVGVHPERNCVSCVCAGVCAVCVRVHTVYMYFFTLAMGS